MADAREIIQEAKRRREETESRSIEETKGRAPDLRRPDERNRENRQGVFERLGPSSSSYKTRGRNLRASPVRRIKENCQVYVKTGLCRFGSRCRYNHPTHLPKEKSGVPICKYFRRGKCKFGSVCVYKHIEDNKDGAEPTYQEEPRRTQRSYVTTESGSRPKKRAKTNLDSAEPDDSRDISEDLEEGPRRSQRSYDTESGSRPKKRAKTNLDSAEPDSRDIFEDLEEGFHQQQQQQQSVMQTPQSGMHHTPQQHPSVQTPQQHQSVQTPQQQPSMQTPQQQPSLASHFNLYPSVEKLADAVEAGTRDQNSDALVTEVKRDFDKCQQLLNAISRSLGSKTNEYVDDQQGKLEESEQLLQQRKALIEKYKKSVEEIVKKEP